MKGRGRSIRTDGYHSSRHHEPEVPTVDLHKLRYHIGVQRLANFMRDQINNGETAVLVIHGHGDGVMEEVVNEWLKSHQNQVADHEPRNNGGARYIRLKRR